jgi:hypothetical protein
MWKEHDAVADGDEKEWSAIFDHVQEATGNNFNLIDKFEIAKFMEEAGFTNIKKKVVKVPIGGLPAQQGMHLGNRKPVSLN